jgi:hypothetical protein
VFFVGTGPSAAGGEWSNHQSKLLKKTIQIDRGRLGNLSLTI